MSPNEEYDRLTFDEEYWPPPAHPLRLVTALIALVGATIVALVWFAGTAGFAGGSSGGSSSSRVAVPALLGLDQERAVAELEAAGFTAEVVPLRNVDVPQGEVFRQNPGAGTLADTDTSVRVVVSAGDAFSVVPQLYGSLFDDLGAELFWFGLGVGEVTYREDSTTSAGEILEQDPLPGVEVPHGTLIDVVVSEGPPPVDVPDVTGLTRDEAERILGDLGFQVTTVQWYSSVRPGRVVSTDPRRGEEAPYGSTIRLYVSRGPAPVRPPTTEPDSPDPTTPPGSTPPTTAPPTTTPPTTAPPAPDPGAGNPEPDGDGDGDGD